MPALRLDADLEQSFRFVKQMRSATLTLKEEIVATVSQASTGLTRQTQIFLG